MRTLSNAFRTGRIAQAYMLTGVRGVGKTTTARILARALNYKTDSVDQPTIDLSTEGEHCRAIIEGRHIDVVEMDAASNTGIDDIRDLIESAQYRPTSARYKVYIIDEVHMLSRSAFNGLLKTLEEPPEHLKFIFATTEIRKVPVTVLSRCQRFDLRRVEADTLIAHLGKICEMEQAKAEPDALAMVARASEGSVRDALSILDQAIAHSASGEEPVISEQLTREMLGMSDRARIVDLFEMVMKGDVGAALNELSDQHNSGAEPLTVMTDLAEFTHLVTRVKYVPETLDNQALSQIEREKAKAFAGKLSVRVLGRAWQMLLKGLSEIGTSERPLAVAEMVLVRIAHAADLPTPDEFIKAGASTSDGSSAAAPVPQSTAGTAPRETVSTSAQPMQTGMASSHGQATSAAVRSVEPVAILHNQAQSEPEQAPLPKGTAEIVEFPEPKKPAPQRNINSFEQFIFLIEDKRDIQFKAAVKRHVRLVSFEDGKIIANLVENAPRDFTMTVTRRLEEWTGKKWVFETSQEAGQPTLTEQEFADNAAQMDDAQEDATVKAVMKTFPGAKVVNIRVREEPQPTPEPAVENDDDDELDEFF